MIVLVLREKSFNEGQAIIVHVETAKSFLLLLKHLDVIDLRTEPIRMKWDMDIFDCILNRHDWLSMRIVFRDLSHYIYSLFLRMHYLCKYVHDYVREEI